MTSIVLVGLNDILPKTLGCILFWYIYAGMNTQEYSQQFLDGLNETQKKAVIHPGNRLLVLAGAGSGKTRTLISRIHFLLIQKKVKAQNLLAITFTKDAANEMIERLIEIGSDSEAFNEEMNQAGLKNADKQRIRQKYLKQSPWLSGITVCTFHSFCYQLLREKGVHQFDNRFRIITNHKSDDFGGRQCPENISAVMQKTLIECCSDPQFLLQLKRYILDYYVDKIEINDLKRSNIFDKPFTTLQREKVRSKSEQYIADWLYRHGIRYQYEPVVNFGDFSFKPDFYIPEANLYLEHISHLSSPMKNKEEQFKKSGKRLVRTFETMTKDSKEFAQHLERIVKGKLSNGYTKYDALNYEEEFAGYHQHIKDFARDVLQVLDKIKVERVRSAQVFARGKASVHQRVRDFYLLAEVLIRAYHKYLVNQSYLDFNDLSIQAVQLLEHRKEIQQYVNETYQHILVDEFQDVNSLQIQLLKKMVARENNLFCVGDDWQGIYGFRGSDVRYIIDFEKYFSSAEVIKLNLNYRSNQTIVEASNEVIRRNKHIVDKELNASNRQLSKLNIYAADEAGIDDVEYFIHRIKGLHKKGYEAQDILVLYRRSKMYEPYRRALEKEELRVNAKTIHSAKGLEARVVIIIGLMQGYGGFPDIWYNDAIYQVIKKEQFHLMLEEERRLFYVALTRAREEINLITLKGKESQFIDEIPLRYFSLPKVNVMSQLHCPVCGQQLSEGDKYCSQCGGKV